MPQSNW